MVSRDCPERGTPVIRYLRAWDGTAATVAMNGYWTIGPIDVLRDACAIEIKSGYAPIAEHSRRSAISVREMRVTEENHERIRGARRNEERQDFERIANSLSPVNYAMPNIDYLPEAEVASTRRAYDDWSDDNWISWIKSWPRKSAFGTSSDVYIFATYKIPIISSESAALIRDYILKPRNVL